MYLKNIEVHGFKSFANKIDFVFHNGITAIVGPNGSGKSNVADAVRWVLGEQSARQLRGSSMQDVIFSGTQARKPMGYASVAITLDNSDHQLATDFEEVTVTRRVFRSGESEYLINGTAVRLRDINELFYDTGIGKEGYSIIGQGQIERILSGKPEDRRELFDEAAGIVKFKRRKAETLKKLGEAENNLTRVNDILSELEKQVGPLERQSEKARGFLKKKEESQKADQERDALEKTIEEKRNELSELKVNREKLQGEIALLDEQNNSSRQNQEQLSERLEKLRQDRDQKDREAGDLKKSKKSVDEEARQAISDRDDARESAQALAGTIKHLRSAIEKQQQYLVDAMSRRNDINSQLSKCDASIEQINIRRAQLNSRLLSARSQEEGIQSELEQCEAAFKEICGKLADIDSEIAGVDEKIRTATSDIRNAEQEQARAQAHYHEIHSKLESMRNLAERYEGYNNAIRRIMEKKDGRVYGVVADILKVDKKYETAIETALGGNIQNIVVKDEETAKEMIGFLRDNRLGRATFLPLTSVKEREFNAPDALKEKGAIGLADTLVKLDEKYKNIASHLLHNYIVVDEIDHAIAMERKFGQTLRCVTLRGEACNPGGSISGGSFKNNSNLLGRKREMEELEAQVKQAREAIGEADKNLNDLRDKRTALRQEVASMREEQQRMFIDQNTARLNLTRIKEKKEETKKGYESLHSEEAGIAGELAKVQSEKNQAAKELENFERSETDVQKKIDEQTRLLNERQEREADITSRLSELEIKAAQLVQKQEHEAENLDRVMEEKQKLTAEMDELAGQIESAGADTKRRSDNIEQLRLTISQADSVEKELNGDIDEATKRREEMDEKRRGYLVQHESLSGRVNSLDKELMRLEGIIEKLEESGRSQYTYMWNEYEISVKEAKELRDETLSDLPSMKKDIMTIKNAIRELGNVNVNAIEEYRELMERYEFMHGQRDDLVDARESLEKIIAELDEGMRTQFSEKFAKIAEQFNKVFKEMFGGGTGTLELLDDEDILEAGIRIIAQPPGKKLQNMMQLSGGEKALTAIALLFAIQNLKPSPFCLLDEIEAALDESNVVRFAGYLKKLTRSTQFIVISHRRGTMEKADRLYGITMQEKGVSALVSVDLIDDKDLK